MSIELTMSSLVNMGELKRMKSCENKLKSCLIIKIIILLIVWQSLDVAKFNFTVRLILNFTLTFGVTSTTGKMPDKIASLPHSS